MKDTQINGNIPVLTDVVSLGALVPPDTTVPETDQDDAAEDFLQESSISNELSEDTAQQEFSLDNAEEDSESPTELPLESTPDDKEANLSEELVDEVIAAIMPEVEKMARKALLEIVQSHSPTK